MADFDINVSRHSLSHIMASAVLKICPEAKLGIGPAIDEGFYYDFLLPEGFSFTAEILDEIKKEMKNILNDSHDYVKEELSIEEAKKLFSANSFKLELIEELEKKGNKVVSTYKTSDFIDLCNGPHVQNTKDLKKIAWELDRVSGAYWRGSEKNPMMQRIYALAFGNKDELKNFKKRRAEAIKRDHRKLGAELELFMFSDLIGRGMPILLPKGNTLRRILERFVIDEEIKRGYDHVYTPVLAKKDLYITSGHWEHYQESMYPLMKISEEDFVLRPMTCPHHFMIYKHRPKSYRDLPLKLAEISPQFRREQSGELSGLTRVMLFHLADAHIFCTREQLEKEFKEVVELIGFIMKSLGIDSIISYRASLKDDEKEKYVKNPEMWEYSEKSLIKILDEIGIEYEKSKGDAAFYGPKLDIQMKNVYGKEETVFTVQIDFSLPEKFELTYADKDGQNKQPVAIHRSSIGCFERTIAFLIEYYAGAFPLWMAPVQARVLSITEKHADYAKEIESKLKEIGIRVESDIRNEMLGKKIREARTQRIPYLLILGDKELEARSITVRNRDTQEQNLIEIEDFLNKISLEDKTKAIKLGI